MSADTSLLGSSWRIGGRYEIRERVGSGAFGVVYRATDAVTGNEVAVKVFDADAGMRATRAWREAAVLRRLNLPGVVRLLDEGRDADGPYLVMPFASGVPFPGPAEHWDANRNTIIISLIELLTCVHGAGIVHGDLKPQNVLVDADGRVTLLDFGTGSWVSGLSCEEQLSRTQGTPAYMAPEQLRGRPATFHSDYYALGVMLYQVLTDSFPHPTDSLSKLVSARVKGPPPRIDAEAFGLSPKLAQAVEGLLSTAADRRVQYLGELVAALDSDQPVSLTPHRPLYLDPHDVVGRAVAAIERGESVDIAGQRGMGKSRCLDEVSRVLRQRGHRVISLIAAEAPFDSLTPLVRQDDRGRGDREQLRQALAAALDEGKLLVADNFEQLDEASRQLLEGERHRGGLIFARHEPVEGGLELQALSIEQLTELFDGPEPIFRLRSEAARQLWLRTGGVPRTIVRQINLWVRHGLAHFRGERVVVPAQQLERLRRGFQLQPASSSMGIFDGEPQLQTLAVWCQLAGSHARAEHLAPLMKRSLASVEAQLDELVERGVASRTDDGRIVIKIDALAASPLSQARVENMHRRLAQGLKPGTPGRLLHLLRAGEDAEVVAEGRAAAAYHDRRGETGLAIAALREAMSACQGSNDADAAYVLFADWTKAALASEETPRIEELLYAIDRAIDRGVPGLERLQALVEVARVASQRPDRSVLDELDALPAFGDNGLELRRQMYRARVAIRCSLELSAQVLDEIEAWVTREKPGREARGSLTGWQASLAYYRGDYARASDLHLRAARIKERPSAKLASIISAVIALMDGLEYEAALEHAEAALARSERLHRHRDQAWCHYLLRSLRYRLGLPLEPADGLHEAFDMLGSPDLCGLLDMVDAAAAFRQGDEARAFEFAREAYTGFEHAGNRRGDALMRALALRCGEEADPFEADKLARFAHSCSAPRIAIQILGLLLDAAPAGRRDWGDKLRELAAAVPEEHRDKRLEVISVAEALAAAEAHR
ncbi:hypothetical protein FIV42_07325 [Persicimonas caeni]|uniref:Protein kinase domain-containing protein n=1 Tax=Persicimonas caeni TaxID=2292766 RepID=A0A4Y6PR06_PERCE|nr:protein kinase [Persicimonas caeni]QDG50549.1 hypothetical protein FIV42_07325 [Persicimonas caeni]QED31770.1 protein kinase [Persicimonas caeni]